LDRQVADLWAAVAVAILALHPLWRALLAVVPPCPARALAGIPCPSCGAGRAVQALLEGRLLAAIEFNPLLALAAAALLPAGLAAPLWVRLGGKLPQVPRPLPLAARAAPLLALAAQWLYLLGRGI
jgi:hypothetical protein